MPKNKNRSRYVIMEEETEAPRKKKSSQPRNTYQAGAMPQMPQGMQRMMPPGVPQGMPQMQQGMQRGMMPQGMPQGAQRGMLNHPAKTAEPPRQNCGFVGGPGVLSGTPGMPSPAGFPSPYQFTSGSMPIPTGVTQPRSNPQFAPSFDDGDDISIPDRSASKMSWHGGEVFSSNDLLVDVFSRDRNNEEPAPKKFRNNASAREETGNEPQSVSRGRPAGRSLDLNTFLSRSSSDSRKEQKEQREPSPAKETRQVSETQIIGPTPTLSLSELLSSGEIQNVEISIKLQNGKTLKLNGGLTG